MGKKRKRLRKEKQERWGKEKSRKIKEGKIKRKKEKDKRWKNIKEEKGKGRVLKRKR